MGKYTSGPAFISTLARTRQWTEWVPFAGGGVPISVDTQTGLYFPIWWALGVLNVPPTVATFTYVQLLHIIGGSLGLFALARSRRVTLGASLIACVAYLFFGGYYASAQHADMARGFACLPWLLWSLTPDSSTSRSSHRRLLALPAIVWLLVSGAYPGQTMAFLIGGSGYLAIELHRARRLSTGTAFLLVLVGGAVISVLLATTLPYLAADAEGLVYRPNPPTIAARASGSFHLRDIFSLYLNPYAWHRDGSVFSVAVGIPMLIGICGMMKKNLIDHSPIAVAGATGFVFGCVQEWRPFGRIAADLPALFPSRFPASDNSALIGLALVFFGSIGWSNLAKRSPGFRVVVVSAALAVGAIIASNKGFAPATKNIGLTTAVVVLALLVAFTLRKAGLRTGVLLVLSLVVFDGFRTTNDFQHEDGTNAWSIHPSAFLEREARDRAAYRLAAVLNSQPSRRPRRVPPSDPAGVSPNGLENDALGYYGLGYFMSDYSGMMTAARRVILAKPELHEFMLAEWSALQVDCSLCGGSRFDLRLEELETSTALRTLSYGLSNVSFSVATAARVLVVENEIYWPGWRSNDSRATPVRVGEAFRGWILEPGRYEFTATFREPMRTWQIVVATLGAMMWLAAVQVSRRRSGVRSSSHERPTEPGKNFTDAGRLPPRFGRGGQSV